MNRVAKHESCNKWFSEKLPSSFCKREACLPRLHYRGKPQIQNCVSRATCELRKTKKILRTLALVFFYIINIMLACESGYSCALDREQLCNDTQTSMTKRKQMCLTIALKSGVWQNMPIEYNF